MKQMSNFHNVLHVQSIYIYIYIYGYDFLQYQNVPTTFTKPATPKG
jgi:hypothetical protein